MAHKVLARRLRRLPAVVVLDREVPVATKIPARLLGLAHLDREQAGAGLLIPRCSSVHTFGMRFALDLVFLDADQQPISARRGVPPCRLAWERRAAAVLELPARGEPLPFCAAICRKLRPPGGEFSRLVP